jgi:hypothetical protein
MHEAQEIISHKSLNLCRLNWFCLRFNSNEIIPKANKFLLVLTVAFWFAEAVCSFRV